MATTWRQESGGCITNECSRGPLHKEPFMTPDQGEIWQVRSVRPCREKMPRPPMFTSFKPVILAEVSRSRRARRPNGRLSCCEKQEAEIGEGVPRTREMSRIARASPAIGASGTLTPSRVEFDPSRILLQMFSLLIHSDSFAQAENSGINLRSHDGLSGSIPIAKLFRLPINIVIRASLPAFDILHQ